MKKRIIFSVISLVIFAFLFIKFGNFEPTKSVVNTIPSTNFNNILTVTEDGNLYLYETNTNKEIDTFDLNKLMGFEKETITISKVTPNVAPIGTPIVKPNVTPNVTPQITVPTNSVKDKTNTVYKGFTKVKVKIKKGDTSWAIQSKFTPNENINKMILLDRQINGKKLLHPIHQGEYRYYLKLKTAKHIQINKKEILPIKPKVKAIIPKPTLSLTPTPSVSITVSPKALKITPKYIFNKTSEGKVLYICNTITKTFYKAEIKDNKISSSVIFSSDNLTNIVDFKVDKNYIYVLTKSNKINILELSNLKESKEYTLDGNVDTWTIDNRTIYYTFDDKIGRYDIFKNLKSNELLGDKSIDVFIKDGKLFVLNNFGNGKGNSLVMKLNAETLYVENIAQLKTTKPFILSDKEDGQILIGQIDNVLGLDKKVTSYYSMGTLNTSSMAPSNPIKINEFTENLGSIKGYIYSIANNKLFIFDVSGNYLKTVNVKGSFFTM